MFEELFEIAENNLAGIEETAVGLPEPQVTVLFTHNKNFYVAVNNTDGCIIKKLWETMPR